MNQSKKNWWSGLFVPACGTTGWNSKHRPVCNAKGKRLKLKRLELSFITILVKQQSLLRSFSEYLAWFISHFIWRPWHDPRHFTVLNLQSPCSPRNPPSRHPCSLTRACDACFAPYGAGTALRSLGADGSPACGLPSCKHYGLFYPRLPYLFEDGETEPASLSVKLQSVLY